MKLRSIGLTGVENARQLGGYIGADGRAVRDNVLIRCGRLTYATDDDKQKLADLKLNIVIDLRDEKEIAIEPAPEMNNVEYIHIGIIDDDCFQNKSDALKTSAEAVKASLSHPENAYMAMAEMGLGYDNVYKLFLERPIGRAGYRLFFDRLLAQSPDKAFLWHCTYGKDRTGCAAALILSALGVSRKDILDDYEATNIFEAELIGKIKSAAKKLTDNDEIVERVGYLAGVKREYMEKTLSYLDEKYGSPIGYLNNVLGLSESDIFSLRRKYLV